jgi:hypothetical protein
MPVFYFFAADAERGLGDSDLRESLRETCKAVVPGARARATMACTSGLA